MKKKVIWMVMSGWMVAALLLTSCAPAVVEEAEKVAPKEKVVVPKQEVVPEVVAPEKETNMVKWTGTKRDGTVVETMIEKPKYGGTMRVFSSEQPVRWDDLIRPQDNWVLGVVQEPLQLFDWTQGRLGTNEFDKSARQGTPPLPGTFQIGLVAESWERPDPDTVVFHIRQGINFALDPASEASRLVGGRQLTAADVAYTAQRNWSIGYFKRGYRYLRDMENVEESVYVSPTDPWAVVLEAKPGLLGTAFRHLPGGRNKIVAREVIEKYGDKGEIVNWEHVVGTGPFTVQDYVIASSLTYVKNPSYWDHDPFFPQNQLPYLDKFDVLMIPDKSTATAALRVGKLATSVDIDGPLQLNKGEAEAFLRRDPELRSFKELTPAGGTVFMRTDTKPFDDVRVRQALALAINNQELKDLYWEGDAEILAYPVDPEHQSVYTPPEEMPDTVRELFEYHPDKARQLLAEAGYPDGFSTEIILLEPMADIFSVIKTYWAKIGVDVELQVKPFPVWNSIAKKKTHTQMLALNGQVGANHARVFSSTVRVGGGQNYSIVNDKWQQITQDRLNRDYFDLANKLWGHLYDPLDEGMTGYLAYQLEQSWYINLPQPYAYTLWWPWLKGFTGETDTAQHIGGLFWIRYAWVDQELKKEMGH